MKCILVTLVFSLIMQYTHGQMALDSINAQAVPADTTVNPSARWYAKETIYLVGGTMYMKNNKALMGKKKLLNEFSISPTGMKLYIRSRRVRNVTMTLSIAGAVGTLITNTAKNRDNLRGLMWTSIGVGLVSSWGTAYADRVRDQAFWTRNYDAMLKMNGDR